MIFPASSCKGWVDSDKRKDEVKSPLEESYFFAGSVMFVLWSYEQSSICHVFELVAT